MNQLNFYLLVLLISTASFLPPLNAGTCEEKETAHIKLDLAKQSIISAKKLYPNFKDETNDPSSCSMRDRALGYLNTALNLITDVKLKCISSPVTEVIPTVNKSLDCFEIQAKNFLQSGVYPIWPEFAGFQSSKPIDVYCDMETDGGGWTVIQRRGNFTEQIDFYRDWNSYKNGFGDIEKEFWLGNHNIFVLTNQRNYSVRFDMVDVKGEYRYAEYYTFSIGDEKSGYILNIKNYSGNAMQDMNSHDGTRFSTKDRQNDGRSAKDACTNMYHSGFWFSKGCGLVNLNGIYQPGKVEARGIWWHSWKRSYECLSSVEIKIRPNV